MTRFVFVTGGIRYEVVDRCSVVIKEIISHDSDIRVPSRVSIPMNKRKNIFFRIICFIYDFIYFLLTRGSYGVIGIPELYNFDYYGSEEKFSSISFDESSKIETIQSSFINCCSKFFLPPRIKRIQFNSPITKCCVALSCPDSKFVSVTRNQYINHHPLEFICHKIYHRPRLSIRETVRIIGGGSYYNNKFIRSVVIPQSVEYICVGAFCDCKNLRIIIFKGKSNLKMIGAEAFTRTGIINVSVVSTVEEIKKSAFSNCHSLSSISFSRDSMLKNIGKYSFFQSIIKAIDFPASVEIIKAHAFDECMSLSSISFPTDSKLKNIGEYAFSNTIIEKVVFPASVEIIGEGAFHLCEKLSSISFLEDSKLRVIGILSIFS